MTSGPTLRIDLGAWLHIWKANALWQVHTKYKAGTLNGFWKYKHLKNLNRELYYQYHPIYWPLTQPWAHIQEHGSIYEKPMPNGWCIPNMTQGLPTFLEIQSTLVISKSKGPSKTVRDIRTSTYQICSIEEKTIWTTKFYKWLCNLTPLIRNIY